MTDDLNALASAARSVAPTAIRRNVPIYFGLRMSASLLTIVSLLAYSAMAVHLANAILILRGPDLPAENWLASGFLTHERTLFHVEMALTGFVAGVFFQALSAACKALRDIARNSYLK